MKKTIFLIPIMALLAACSEKVGPETEVTQPAGDPICFSIPQDLSTKAPVYTDQDLTVTNSEVRIYGTKSGTVMTNFNNTKLSYNGVTGLWAPGNSETWGYDATNHQGLAYSFWAYGFNKVNGSVTPTLTTSGDNFGKVLTLVEPASYSHQEGGFGYDYLLSQRFEATSYAVVNGDIVVYRGPIVRLHMEHALALIDVKLKVHKDLYHVELQGVELSNFYRGGTMTCSFHAAYGNTAGDINKWAVSNYSNSGASYSRGSVVEGTGNTTVLHDFAADRADDANQIDLMLFTAIPQKPSNAQLKVALLVQEVKDSPIHQVISVWDLNNYYDWEYGYRNVYTINVDTSNKLDATIDNWPVVNNVSGTILPRL